MDIIQLAGLGLAVAGAACSATFAVLKIRYSVVIEQLKGQIQTLLERVLDLGIKIRLLESSNSQLVAENEKLRHGNGEVRSSLSGHVETLKSHLSDPNFDLWTFSRGSGPITRSGSPVPVVSVINFKGGVGKTTFTSSLACYLAAQKHARVLLVDIDYQGSLTNLCRRAWVSKQGRFPIAGFSKVVPGEWLYTDQSPQRFIADSFNLDAILPQSALLETDYKFLSIESRSYLRWAIDPEVPDARTRLRQLLHSDYVANHFDVVLIDCPPRLSLGAVNALVASTHFIIPTIFDRLSAEPIELLLSQLAGLFEKDEGPKFLGVVGMQTDYVNNWRNEELRIKDEIDRVLKEAHAPNGVFPTSIPNRVAFLKTAGQKFAYQAESDVRAWVDPIGDEFVRRIGGIPRRATQADAIAAE